MRTKNYSDYISRVSGLIGIPVDGFNNAELEMLNGYFQTNLDDGWQRANWIDLSPYGEARFVGNKLTYPNDLSKTAYWTGTNVTITAEATTNPADGRTTATRVMETSATGAHSVVQSVALIPNQNYEVFGFARYNGRSYIKLSLFDGSSTFSMFINLVTGTVGTTSGLTANTISQQNNGFWFWSISLTASASASTGTFTIQGSTDGSTVSYAGDTTKGFYAWGNVVLQTGNPGPECNLVAWDQPGEEVIESVFEVWRNSPKNAAPPWRQPYEITPNGLQMLAPGSGWIGGYFSPPVTATSTYSNLPPNPVYIYYRKQAPDFEGDDFDASAVYSVGDHIFFEDADGVENFYKCIVATTIGQSPTTTPTSWQVLTIPDFLFRFIVFSAYADWLRQDGQFDKAQGADRNAEDQLLQEFDKLERQMGWAQPMRVQTHVTSRANTF